MLVKLLIDNASFSSSMFMYAFVEIRSQTKFFCIPFVWHSRIFPLFQMNELWWDLFIWSSDGWSYDTEDLVQHIKGCIFNQYATKVEFYLKVLALLQMYIKYISLHWDTCTDKMVMCADKCMSRSHSLSCHGTSLITHLLSRL